jgi:hypothetical protein
MGMTTVLSVNGKEITCEGHLKVLVTLDDGVITKLLIQGMNDAGEIDATIDVLKLSEFCPPLRD